MRGKTADSLSETPTTLEKFEIIQIDCESRGQLHAAINFEELLCHVAGNLGNFTLGIKDEACQSSPMAAN